MKQWRMFHTQAPLLPNCVSLSLRPLLLAKAFPHVNYTAGCICKANMVIRSWRLGIRHQQTQPVAFACSDLFLLRLDHTLGK